MLRTVHPDDATAIAEIYNHYVRETPVTFEEDRVAPEEMRQRILETTRTYPWLVCEEDGRLLGYSYARKWRERAAYRRSVEATIYLHPSAVGQGKGSILFDALLAELRNRQFHCASAASRCPILRALRCLRSSDCARWPTSKRLATNSAAGSMSATGSSCFERCRRIG